jgi:phosphoglycerate dehydrogenase-like enzyme
MDPASFPMLFPTGILRRIERLVGSLGLVDRLDDPRIADRLADLEIVITGWGCPPLDDAFLSAAPNLRAVLHTAGSVKHLIPPAGWARGLTACSAAEANAVPVAEFTRGAILLSGKGAFGLRERYRAARGFTVAEVIPHVGNYRRTVGIDARRLALMRDGAVLINTARGGLVDTGALIAELRTGRIEAVLDVTEPEPLPADSPLLDLPNVFLTPHIAGSQGNELQRLGTCTATELERLVADRPLRHQVHHHELDRAA